MHNFNVATVDCSFMFRLVHYLSVKQFPFYTSGIHTDEGYFGVVETCSCSLHLLH